LLVLYPLFSTFVGIAFFEAVNGVVKSFLFFSE